MGHCIYQIAKARGIKSINIIRNRPNSDELVERMKKYGADVVVSDDMMHNTQFNSLLTDLPKPKLAFNCIGGPSATNILRLLA